MVMVAATTTASHLTSTFLSTPDFCGLSRSLQWPHMQRRCTRKYVPGAISASIDLKPPPYALHALEPHMSKETLEYHWGKHHRAYVDNLNKQIEGTELDGMSLESIISASYNKGDILPAFNNAAQIWNHEFFWESMKPDGGGKPTGELLELINRDFGSFEGLINKFKSAATTQFGSGWAWLVYKEHKLDVPNARNPRPSEEDNKLVVVKSPNAVNPLVWEYHPLLTLDVWEHAYYLDFENRRPDYILTFLDKLVSWETVSSRLEAAKVRVAESEKEMAEIDADEDLDTIEPEDTDMYFGSEAEDAEDFLDDE
ncbi:superoxide dismutase [Fe], chloroplastic [Cynara cardunculus var. scolymus]|uniref:superoxide dismutase [Fe], chloroplastic n=1 Tax=Cynara cardunculus var. scolymus TaxID=59895 RepID=UPI000D6243FE|nr:superoxide dismutase [Fe], chloroplastic [Cynara cardunculus var. scolymus]